jgi:hypothetical protein
MIAWINHGRLQKWVVTVGQIIGIGCGFVAYSLAEDMSSYKFWVFASVAFLFGYGFSWAGLMQKWGYRPFTNDPLDWRAAKASYEVNQSTDGENEKATKE